VNQDNSNLEMGCRYLGLYAKEIDAAQAYDRESVKRKGLKAITNFDISEYLELLSTSLYLPHTPPPPIPSSHQCPPASTFNNATGSGSGRVPRQSINFEG